MKLAKRLVAMAIVLVMLFALLPLGAFAADPAPDNQFVIMSTTDIHGKVWDYNFLSQSNESNNLLAAATAVKGIREEFGEKTVLVDNGDLYQGTPVSSYNINQLTQAMADPDDENTYDKPNPMAIALKYMDYDAAGLGNHEFNYAWRTMKSIYDYLADDTVEPESLKNSVPMICGNLYDKDTGERIFDPYITKTITVDGHPFKILIIGMENTDCTRWDIPDNYPNMTFGDPKNGPIAGKTNADTRDMVYEVQKVLDEVEAANVNPDFTMLVYHSGLGQNIPAEDLVVGTNTEGQVLRVISQTTGIDMVIAGHDHSSGYSGNTYQNKDGKDVYVANGGGTTLTKTVYQATYADGGFTVTRVTDSNPNLGLSSYAADADLKALIQPYADDANTYVNTIVGTLAGEWDSVSGSNNLYLKQSDTMDLVGRAQMVEGTKYLAQKYPTVDALNARLKEMYGADTALQYKGDKVEVDMSSSSVVVNGSAHGTPGDKSIKDIYTYYRYDNNLYLIPLTGQQIKDLLEYNASERIAVRINNGEASFSTKGESFTHPVFYGLNFVYDMSREDGDRAVIEGFSNGKKFDLNETYIFAINNYHLGNSGNTELAKYSTEDQLWSQTDDQGGGVVQDLMAEYIGEMTKKDGGVYSNSAYNKETGLNGNGEPVSHWAIVYTGEITTPGEIPDNTKYIADLVEDPSTLADGDTVFVYNPGNSVLMTGALSGNRLGGADDAIVVGKQLGTNTDAAQLTVKKAADGHYIFLNAEGKYITSGAAGNSMSLEDADSELAHWTFEATDGGFNVHNEAAAYNGNTNQYLEYYSGFTTYGLNGGGTNYTMQLYKLSGAEAPCEHKNTEVRDAKAATCTESGYTGDTYCKDCGEKIADGEPIAALGHDWGEWTTLYAATDTLYGYECRSCKRCNLLDTRQIEKVKDCLFDDYTDLDNTKWYHSGVEFAIANQLMDGVGTASFAPNGTLTRGMLVTILYRASGQPSTEGLKNPFTDVDVNRYYGKAVLWAADMEIINGIGENKFAPDDPITREQIAAILYRFAGKPTTDGDLTQFTDGASVSNFATEAMRWAVKSGIFLGDHGALRPKDGATRAELATILMRWLIEE